MSGIRSLTRRSTIVGFPSAASAPIYVDADDNRVKVNVAGSGTTETILQEASGSNAAEVTSATNILTAAESGKTLFLNSATEFVTTLPVPALGLKFKVVVAAAPSGANYTVVTDAAAEIIIGQVHAAVGDAGDTENTAGGTTLTFVDGQAVAGDTAFFESDGTNWYVQVFVAVVAGATITG